MNSALLNFFKINEILKALRSFLHVITYLVILLFSLNSLASETNSLPKNLNIGIPSQQVIDVTDNLTIQNLVNFLKEYWQIWAIDQGVEVHFIPLATEDMYAALANKTIDIVAINIYDAESDVLFSIPYAKFNQRLYHRIAGDKNDGIQLGIHSATPSTLDFLGSHITRTYFQEIDDLLENYKSYDALYSEKPWLLTKKLQEKGISKEFYDSADEVPVSHLRFATRKQDRQLMKLINNSLRQVSSLQAELWSSKYLGSHDSILTLSLGNYLVNLPDEEQEYVIDHQELLYPMSEKGFPPYLITKSFSNISESGFTIDLLKVIEEKTGITFKPFYVSAFRDSLKVFEQNDVDLLVQIEITPKRLESYLFSKPYIKANYNIVFRQQYEFTRHREDLNEETVAAVKGYITTTRLKQLYPQAIFKEYQSVEDALQAVASGDASVFVGRTLTSAYLINSLELSNLASLPLNNFNKDGNFGFAALKTEKQLITLLNRSISSIPSFQFDEIYSRWSQTALTNEAQGQLNYIYRQIGYVGLLILVVIAIIFFFYYKQRKIELEAKQKVEQALALAEVARSQAEKSAQAKITFLARMSHEIRTPMNGVLGMAESLAFTPLNNNQAALLDTLKGSANNLLALLNDILDFSKMDAGKLTLEQVPTDLSKLTLDIVDSFTHIRHSKNVALTANIDPELSHYYLTDPTRISQVFNNLLSNAVKFTQQGKITLTISKTKQLTIGDKHYDTLLISVKDTGIGIPEAQQSNLFTPFIQADDEVTRKYGGTGLGLSICQEIVMALGSRIRITSNENVGSDFYFSLDFQQVNIEKSAKERRKSPRLVASKEDDRFSELRVLIAEDNLVNIKVLSAQLARLNINADVAEDGEQALAMHMKDPYDIILSDCHMPNMDGFELARSIRQLLKRHRQVWLIAITADALSGAAENCIAAGFDDYMAKPCAQEEVADKLNHAYRQVTQNSNTNNHSFTP